MSSGTCRPARYKSRFTTQTPSVGLGGRFDTAMIMSLNTPPSPVFVIDPREGTVTGPGGEVRLEPKVMQVLIVLARYSGHVVSRAELLDTIWAGTVVTEDTLSRCIYQLREQLRSITSRSGAQDYNAIETLPKRGYRLLATIEGTPPEMRISGDRLLIELRRPTVLFIGLGLFLVFVILFFVGLS